MISTHVDQQSVTPEFTLSTSRHPLIVDPGLVADIQRFRDSTLKPLVVNLQSTTAHADEVYAKLAELNDSRLPTHHRLELYGHVNKSGHSSPPTKDPHESFRRDVRALSQSMIESALGCPVRETLRYLAVVDLEQLHHVRLSASAALTAEAFPEDRAGRQDLVTHFIAAAERGRELVDWELANGLYSFPTQYYRYSDYYQYISGIVTDKKWEWVWTDPDMLIPLLRLVSEAERDYSEQSIAPQPHTRALGDFYFGSQLRFGKDLLKESLNSDSHPELLAVSSALSLIGTLSALDRSQLVKQLVYWSHRIFDALESDSTPQYAYTPVLDHWYINRDSRYGSWYEPVQTLQRLLYHNSEHWNVSRKQDQCGLGVTVVREGGIRTFLTFLTMSEQHRHLSHIPESTRSLLSKPNEIAPHFEGAAKLANYRIPIKSIAALYQSSTQPSQANQLALDLISRFSERVSLVLQLADSDVSQLAQLLASGKRFSSGQLAKAKTLADLVA